MDIIITAVGGALTVALLLYAVLGGKRERYRVAARLSALADKKDGEKLKPRREILEKPLFERTVRPILKRLGGRMKSRGIGNGASDARLQKQLDQAGSRLHASEYKALRLGITVPVTLAATALAVFFISAAPVYETAFVLAVAASPYIIMRYLIAARITKRKNAIGRQLPDVLDLLSVTVEAGVGFEQAVDYIVSEMDGDLIDELAVTSREISMGRDRRSAFLLLGERCGVESVISFVSVLVQSIDMGIPMRTLLRSQAESMRLHRRRLAEERAMKLSTKLLFPLVLFIFPVLFIILLGPAFINILEIL